MAVAWNVSTGYTMDLNESARGQALAALEQEGMAIHLSRTEPEMRRRVIDRVDVLCDRFDSIYVLNAGIRAMAKVAEGGLAAFANPSTNLWDVGAAETVVRACGGRVTDWDGRPISYDTFVKTSVLATRRGLHKAGLHEEIRKIFALTP